VIIVEARKELMGAVPKSAPARRVERLATAQTSRVPGASRID
jgi:hypothetical protein